MNISQKRIVTYWLYLGLILVGLMIIIGGITRLTNSGLSMVEWELIKGTIPPLNETEWQEKFTKYQQHPEYQEINPNMLLNEFKKIFFWEYLHRIWGRLIGLVFIIPFVIFWTKKWLNTTQKKQLVVLLGFGALQAFIGWFMVKSGLVDIPAVSHYRLAIHLITAFGLMCYIYWLILSLNNIKREPNQRINQLSKWLISVLVIQIIYGAFVAGKDAGYSVPVDGGVFKKIFGYTTRIPNNFNLLENGLDIQAFHRIFAWFVFAISIIIYNKSKNTNLRTNGMLVFGLVITQISLGIATLLSSVQIHTAITHQFIAILLLLSVIHLTYLSSEKFQSNA